MANLRLTEAEARAKYKVYLKLKKEKLSMVIICRRLGRPLSTVIKIKKHFEGVKPMVFKRVR